MRRPDLLLGLLPGDDGGIAQGRAGEGGAVVSGIKSALGWHQCPTCEAWVMRLCDDGRCAYCQPASPNNPYQKQ